MDRIEIIPNLKTVMNTGNITGANSIFLSDMLSATGANAFVFNTINNFEGLLNFLTFSDRDILLIQNQSNLLLRAGRIVDDVGIPITLNYFAVQSTGTSLPFILGSVFMNNAIEYQFLLNIQVGGGLSIDTSTNTVYLGGAWGNYPYISVNMSTTMIELAGGYTETQNIIARTGNNYDIGAPGGHEYRNVFTHSIYSDYLYSLSGTEMVIANDLRPSYVGINLGNSSYRFGTLYVQNIDMVGTLNIIGTSSNWFTIDMDNDGVQRQLLFGNSIPYGCIEYRTDTGEINARGNLVSFSAFNANGERFFQTRYLFPGASQIAFRKSDYHMEDFPDVNMIYMFYSIPHYTLYVWNGELVPLVPFKWTRSDHITIDYGNQSALPYLEFQNGGGRITYNPLASEFSFNGKIISNGLEASYVNSTQDVEILTSGYGLILKSPDGTRWRVTVDDNGVLTTTRL
jgi:hypothetical protein